MKPKISILALLAVLLSGCVVSTTENSDPTVTPPAAPQSAATENSPAIEEVPASETPSPVVAEEPVIERIVNVKDIARKTMSEVNGILGDPVFTEEINFAMGPELKKRPVTMNHYIETLDGDLGRVEIMFANDKAVRVRVNLIGDQYNKEDKSKNLELVGLSGVTLDPVKKKEQVRQSVRDVEGFYLIDVGDWLGTDDGSILIVTEEEFK
ncbi:hypothetical protein [Cohnella phaseoli]|nr:hypothetical protein [Cohnella phaseoli]